MWRYLGTSIMYRFVVIIEGEHDIVLGEVIEWLDEGNLYKVRHKEHEKKKMGELYIAIE